jgi:hypothetical protein
MRAANLYAISRLKTLPCGARNSPLVFIVTGHGRDLVGLDIHRCG